MILSHGGIKTVTQNINFTPVNDDPELTGIQAILADEQKIRLTLMQVIYYKAIAMLTATPSLLILSQNKWFVNETTWDLDIYSDS